MKFDVCARVFCNVGVIILCNFAFHVSWQIIAVMLLKNAHDLIFFFIPPIFFSPYHFLLRSYSLIDRNDDITSHRPPVSVRHRTHPLCNCFCHLLCDVIVFIASPRGYFPPVVQFPSRWIALSSKWNLQETAFWRKTELSYTTMVRVS